MSPNWIKLGSMENPWGLSYKYFYALLHNRIVFLIFFRIKSRVERVERFKNWRF